MLLRRIACRTAARLSAAISRPVQALIEPLENRRLFNAGLLDPTFGSGGEIPYISVSTTGGPSPAYNGGGVVVQSNGKTVVLGLTPTGATLLERLNADGSIDTTFGSAGSVTSTAVAEQDVALAPGDKLVVVGGSTVARFNADGSVDTTFGNGTGAVTLAQPASSVSVGSDGKIVTGGTGTGADGLAAAEVQRLNADGTVDASFANNGVYFAPIVGVGRSVSDVVVEASGKVAAVGNQSAAGSATTSPFVIELNTNGTADGVTFDTGGLTGDTFNAVAEGQGGGLVAVGASNADPQGFGLVVRFVGAGASAGQLAFVDNEHDGVAPDPFGYGGITRAEFDKVVVQPNGAIVAAGKTNAIFGGLYVVRLDAAGNVDRSFGNYGATYVAGSPGNHRLAGLAVTPDGRVRAVVDDLSLPGNNGRQNRDLYVVGLTNDAAPTPGDGLTPAAPTNLTLGLANPGVGVTVAFTESSTDATGFVLERATTLNGPYTFITDLPPTAGNGAVAYTDQGVASNTEYYYRVSAYNYSKLSAPSAVASIASQDTGVVNPGGAPNGPFALTASAPDSGSVNVAFYDSATNETGFVLERATSATGPWIAQTSTPIAARAGSGSQVTFVDGGVTPGATYYFRVYAVNGTAQSNIAGPVSVTVPNVTGSERPYNGVPAGVPGTIQAENYDLGGEGVAYHDTDAVNQGGEYRSDGVDVESTPTGGYAVDYVRNGEYLRYTVNVAATGTYDLKLRLANVGSGAGLGLSSDGFPLSGFVAVPDTGGFSNYTDVDAGNVSLTAGTHVVTVSFGAATQYGFVGNLDSFTFTPVQSPPSGGSPFNNTPFVPGKIVQAENFNTGGEGVAYHDTDAANLGGQYRPTEGVDLEATTDLGGGYDVGYVHTGESLNYTGVFSTGGNYDFTARLASAAGGGSYHVNVDGVNVIGPQTVANTGGFQTWYTQAKAQIPIAAGTHVVQIVFDTQAGNGFVANLNWFEFTPSSPGGEASFGNALASLPGTVQAEQFDTGGEGVAYHDTDAANLGAAERPNEGVDIETLGSNNYAVDYTHAGEYLNYTVSVAAAGTYTFDARLANVGAGAAFHVEVDGVNVTGSLAVPNTGSFTTYVDALKSGIALTAGQHVVRFAFDANTQYGFAGNLDYFRFA